MSIYRDLINLLRDPVVSILIKGIDDAETRKTFTFDSKTYLRLKDWVMLSRVEGILHTSTDFWDEYRDETLLMLKVFFFMDARRKVSAKKPANDVELYFRINRAALILYDYLKNLKTDSRTRLMRHIEKCDDNAEICSMYKV